MIRLMTPLKRAGAPLIALGLSACSVFGLRGATPEQHYQVISHVGRLQIRRYAPRLVAETMVTGTEIDARYKGFRRLAAYIFGANRARIKIAMTAPVAQSSATIAMTTPVAQQKGPAGEWRVAFTMPEGYTKATLPQPTDPAIRIEELPAIDYAVWRYSGIPDAGAVREARRRLMAELKRSDWRVVGQPVSWFYDPPWAIPFLRRNEEAVPVELIAR